MDDARPLDLEAQWLAPNYRPLPVTLCEGKGVWVTDVDGRRYLDFLAGYSALNFGHRHPALTAAAHAQLDRLTLTSRAFRSDTLGPFAAALAGLCGMERVLPMNTGAEAVETAIKAARRWGYRVKGVPRDQAEIIVCENNFHGRTTTIVGFSTDPGAREDFGPFTPGFVTVPFGDLAALEAAITPRTVGFLFEPIQGEAGVMLPPEGYLRGVRALCDRQQVLMIADEIQAGLGRTGETFACDHEGVKPDLYVLGKALGGGVLPLSAVVGSDAVLGLLTAGSHGSTFGGNPLACAVGLAVVRLLESGEFQDRARQLGQRLATGLAALQPLGLSEVRCRGLWAGIDLAPSLPSGRAICERMLRRGLLAKDTHGQTLRLAPPLVISEAEVDQGLAILASALRDS
jgi:ornithine--oxo-acid transaminase